MSKINPALVYFHFFEAFNVAFEVNIFQGFINLYLIKEWHW